jgi:hypothetical protein
MNQNLDVVNMFWHGSNIGAVHAACIRSFQRHGHHVRMHCYDIPKDLPDNVEVFDASILMPRSDLIASPERGGVALGADRYRYRILNSGMGLYCDCDVYCLREIPNQDYIFGWEDNNQINNAVLKYPKNSPLAQKLLTDTSSEYFIPHFVSKRKRMLLKARRALGFGKSVRRMPWGVWGPTLLTHNIKDLGLKDKALPIDYFYPVHYFSTNVFLEPSLRLSDLITSRTIAVHLCHKMLNANSIPESSPIWEILNS